MYKGFLIKCYGDVGTRLCFKEQLPHIWATVAGVTAAMVTEEKEGKERC